MRGVASLRQDRGITLVELLVVVAISAVVLGTVVTSVAHALQAQRRQTAQINALNEAKHGFERVTRDIRAADPLRVAEPHRVRLDTRGDEGMRTVTYTYDDGALVVEEADAAPARLVSDVSVDEQPVFRFHLVDGTTVSDEAVADPRLVHSITVRLRVAPPVAGEVVRLDNRVLLRNQRP